MRYAVVGLPWREISRVEREVGVGVRGMVRLDWLGVEPWAR